MHQYAPFQMTKIGGLGRDVNHACQLPHGCLDPLMSITGHIDNKFCDAHIGVDNNIGVTIFCGCLKTAGHYATPWNVSCIVQSCGMLHYKVRKKAGQIVIEKVIRKKEDAMAWSCHENGWSMHSEASAALGSCGIQEKTWQAKDELGKCGKEGPLKDGLDLGRSWSISSRQTFVASSYGPIHRWCWMNQGECHMLRNVSSPVSIQSPNYEASSLCLEIFVAGEHFSLTAYVRHYRPLERNSTWDGGAKIARPDNAAPYTARVLSSLAMSAGSPQFWWSRDVRSRGFSRPLETPIPPWVRIKRWWNRP